jgi:hypothetical protein
MTASNPCTNLSIPLTSACCWSAALCSLNAWGQDAPNDGVYKDRIDWGC